MVGQVKIFGKKGYGFILGEDGVEYFCHQTDIAMEGFRTLSRGDKVEFEVGMNENNGKNKAVNVKKVG
jgi:CspA family cold shock protein